MNWLTMKVLQYIAGGLLLACIGLGVRGCALDSARDVAVANQGKAEAARDTAITERDAWKSKAGDALAANEAFDAIFEKQRLAAAEQQRLAEASAAKAAAAVAAAQRDEAKAERSLAEFRRLFGTRPTDCDAALQALDRVCPMLGGY
jgi:hypothetical protein